MELFSIKIRCTFQLVSTGDEAQKEEKAQGLGFVIGVSTIKKSMYVTTRRRFEGIGENHGFSACR
ncbi:MAG: hypothetical protein Q3Y12_19595, partial [Phocaeicola sp.]|nr:hypothetical protein [Phocaeicola sp.]